MPANPNEKLIGDLVTVLTEAGWRATYDATFSRLLGSMPQLRELLTGMPPAPVEPFPNSPHLAHVLEEIGKDLQLAASGAHPAAAARHHAATLRALAHVLSGTLVQK